MNASCHFALPRRAGTAAGAVVVGVTLALTGGCTSNPEPKPLANPTGPAVSPTESTTPTPTPPALPEDAKGLTKASAKAFAHHLFDTINYASRTGDATPIRALGTRDCVSCEAIAANIERVYEAGGHIESEGWKLYLVTFAPLQPRDRPILDLGVVQSDETFVIPGEETQTFDGGKQPMTLHLVRAQSGWLASRLDLVR